MHIKNLDQLNKLDAPDFIKDQIRPHLDNVVQVKQSKYRNKIIEIDGIKFRSKKEGQYYLTLKAREKAGDIKGFTMQVPFPVTKEGKKIRYFLDFMISNNDGSVEYVDTKGVKTALYKLKKQLVKEIYGIDIKEV